MEEPNTICATWRKSTRSNGSGDCVEVADDLGGMIGLRDSKDPNGPALSLDPESWSAFVTGIKHDRLGMPAG